MTQAQSTSPGEISSDREGRATLVAALDVQENEQSITEYMQETNPDVELAFVPFFTTDMPTYVAQKLTLMAARLEVSFVIVATEPLAHTPYGLWALSAGLNVIMDKPISTRRDACINLQEAYGIVDDFNVLWGAYRELQRVKKTCFLVNSHRRYHPGFQFALQKIVEIQQKTGCPVTNINTTHCDGQWRMPTEIVDQRYHTYNMGYGKVSHSGYHFIDTAWQYIKAGLSEGKRPDRVEVVSSFVRPNGFLMQLTTPDYERLFGREAYGRACRYTDAELRQLYAAFGEVDASVQLTFVREGEAVALAQLNLQHNGFSRRHWLLPPADLYKGNGRVKHELHEVKSGPFQTLAVASKQANDKHDRARLQERKEGAAGQRQPLRDPGVSQLRHAGRRRGAAADTPGLLSENVKRGILEDAIGFAQGERDIGDLQSNLADHSIPASVMSATYISHIRRKAGLSPVVTVEMHYGQDAVIGAIATVDPAWEKLRAMKMAAAEEANITAVSALRNGDCPPMYRNGNEDARIDVV
ncbi:Cytochrome P450 monooxygenase [Apiospora kogelbergensis]|uniref:Cytochrome P450 monooxygenase n=1 Tax=Apiospora kogelbergensis TaxID=1337665 RepID=UPI00312EC3C6